MVEYVYALHDFAPEHDDEISFRAGERIEVVEKDDLYGDGWWQGRNLAGKVGLFPQGYTTPTPAEFVPEVRTPTSGTPLQPLHEEPSDVPSTGASARETASPEPAAAAEPPHETVMAATMTDVQQAIDQLGVRSRDQAANRSFSFMSTQGSEHAEAESDGEGWHKDARAKLVEKIAPSSSEQRLTAPPIDVELSDESEDEDEDGLHARIMENIGMSPPTFPSLALPDNIPAVADTHEPEPESARASSEHGGSPQSQPTPLPEEPALPTPAATPLDLASSLPASPALPTALPTAVPQLTSYLEPTPKAQTPIPPKPAPTSPPPQAPMIVTTPTMVYSPPPPVPQQPHSLPSPAMSASGAQFVPLPISPQPAAALPSPKPEPVVERSHPSEWNVEQVVDWIRSRGFDESVCAKFMEHEITGDVLLQFDVNMLKEIDIPAFGKRMRIANAIKELQRPASLVSSSEASARNTAYPMPQIAQYSAPPHGHAHQYSLSNSLNSPARQSTFTSADSRSPYTAPIFSPESPLHTGDMLGSPFPEARPRRTSDPGIELPEGDSNRTLTGLGITSPAAMFVAAVAGKSYKNRPASLALSPSDGNLGARVHIPPVENAIDPRAVMSDSENTKDSGKKRRKGAAANSTTVSASSSQITNEAKDSSTAASSVADGTTPLSRGKRSIDGSRDRLSFFGAALGKSRKPAPRYSSETSDTSPSAPIEKERSTRSFSRLYNPSSTSKKSRASATGTANKEDHNHKEETEGKSKSKDAKKDSKGKDKGAKDIPPQPASPSATVLRKRATSDGQIQRPAPSAPDAKAGEKFLDQIGEPDHCGWMRKKGERYNTWKLRYFVLKGPHLYYLRNKTESKIKGYINIDGYKVISDEGANPGKYGFRIVHDKDKPHYFSSDEQLVVREWMKAFMKATIDRDYTRPVVSSSNIPTIPLAVAQAMNPPPRPPSPSARDATQKAMRRENPNQLSSRDARILMGLETTTTDAADPLERSRLESFFTVDTVSSGQGNLARKASSSDSHAKPAASAAPVRPSREMRRPSVSSRQSQTPNPDTSLLSWLNSNLPESSPQATDLSASLSSGLILFRLAETIKHGKNHAASSPVPDSAFPVGPEDEKLDGMFKLFDFLVENDIKVSVSISDVRQGRKEKIVQLVKALKSWDEKRQALARSIGAQALSAGAFMTPVLA